MNANVSGTADAGGRRPPRAFEAVSPGGKLGALSDPDKPAYGRTTTDTGIWAH